MGLLALKCLDSLLVLGHHLKTPGCFHWNLGVVYFVSCFMHVDFGTWSSWYFNFHGCMLLSPICKHQALYLFSRGPHGYHHPAQLMGWGYLPSLPRSRVRLGTFTTEFWFVTEIYIWKSNHICCFLLNIFFSAKNDKYSFKYASQRVCAENHSWPNAFRKKKKECIAIGFCTFIF